MWGSTGGARGVAVVLQAPLGHATLRNVSVSGAAAKVLDYTNAQTLIQT